MLALVPGALAAAKRKQRKPATHGEFVRFADPTTEAWVLRLTSLSSANVLPEPQNHYISSKHRFLLFSSNRDGAMMPYRLDLRNGVLHRLARTKHLDPQSLRLDAQERFAYYVDNGALTETALSSGKTRTIAENITAFGMADSEASFVVVRKRRLFRLQSPQPIAEDVTFGPLLNPNGTALLFGREAKDGREFWYVPLTQPAKPKLLASGRIWNPFWSPHGKLLFLRDVQANTAMLAEIHEVDPAGGAERKIDSTSDYAVFAPNTDASVFVAASRSKAQPNILLLLRKEGRELTLCEHDASHPASVAPVFSPNSRDIFFQSDREGKPAIYAMNVQKFVDPT